MSAVRRVSTEQPILTGPPVDFSFPGSSHLLIICPSKIYSWDSTGIKTIFQSSKGGIAAVREAKDGSGVLAIADKQVVVLHDTKRGQEKSWGLAAEQDEVRHLEYTTDAKSLFLSTQLTADIQRYSTERSRLLDPTNIHPSSPVALAISPTGHMMVSASDQPPTVYMKNLAQNTSPILIEPRASRAAVSVIAFHPERANIFLMAFRDGSVAAYDCTRVGRHQGGQYADQYGVGHGQIASFSKLHRATTETSTLASITGATFLPGFKTRAITVGSDGRCRVVDFAGKGEVLRTWHAKAPVTSVAVLCLKDQQSLERPLARSRASHTIGGPTSTDNIIAVGRADGAVYLYDVVGLLLEQKAVSEKGEKVLSVDWVKGPSPRPISETIIASGASEIPHVPAQTSRRETKVQSDVPAVISPTKQSTNSTLISTRKFTVHPDEVDEGTVRRTPMPENAQAPPTDKGAYLDLFSPVKATETTVQDTEKPRVASPGRSRPRISSQTFVKSPEPGPTTGRNSIAKSRNIALFPSTDDTEDTVSSNTADRQLEPASAKTAYTAQKQRITLKPSERRWSRKSLGSRTVPAQANPNAKVLADLRKMSTTRTAQNTGGVLSAFAISQDVERSRCKHTTKNLFHPSTEHIETDLSSTEALRVYDEVRREKEWVVDSEQDEDALCGDIWLTSDSGDELRTRRSRRERAGHTERPPARQTSRTRVTSRGTMSTIAPAQKATAPTALAIDGSTKEEAMQTAQSHLSPSGSFSPSSQHVRQLFPRTSSLSPRRKQKRSPTQRPHRDPPREAITGRTTLREMTLNTAHLRGVPQAKSPWAKMRASKASVTIANPAQLQPQPQFRPSVEVFEDPATTSTTTDGTEDETHCAVCEPTRARIVVLESEVARLRGDVLALKAVLRRNGIQVSNGT